MSNCEKLLNDPKTTELLEKLDGLSKTEWLITRAYLNGVTDTCALYEKERHEKAV